MKKFDLNAILKKARTPQPPGEFWEEFPGQVARQLNRPARENRAAPQPPFLKVAWALAAAACVLAAFAMGRWRGQNETRTAPFHDLLANTKVVRETLAMFPGQVRAIVEDQHGLHLVLSSTNDVPESSAPLYVRICNGIHCSSLVTFSGQQIEMAGQKMTVLADTHGGIIVMGDDFVWSSDKKIDSDAHLKIEAMNLGPKAL